MPRKYPIEKVRNIGIIAHIDAGKTTVSERILFYTGVSHKIGEVHEGTTVMDWMEQERERGITITAAATTCFWIPTYAAGAQSDSTGAASRQENQAAEYQINLIDTPGHIDFTVEVKRSLRVLDGAVIVFDGVAGVEPQSETNWRYADDYRVPRICFINKLDRMGASFENSLRSIHERLTSQAVALQLPIGIEDGFRGIIDLLTMQAFTFTGEAGEAVTEIPFPEELRAEAQQRRHHLIEKIVEQDEQATADYLEGKELPPAELKRLLRQATLQAKLIPVLCGSALKNKGVQFILDAVVDYLPAPSDMPPIKGIDPKTNQELVRRLNDEEPFAALAFKIAADPFVGTLTFFRVYSGILRKGTYVLNSTKGHQERISRILRLHANRREDVDEIYSGELGGLVGLKNTLTGDTLSDPDHPAILEKIIFPEPVISIRVEPKTKADQEKLSLALRRLAEEDPTFRVSGNPETGETIIAGMGELHLEIIVDRMKREFTVEANVGRPQVAYKETITAAVESEGKYIRQSGGRGQYGHVRLKLEPRERGSGFEFVDAVKGGAIPQEFISAVEKGVAEALTKGINAGYPVVDVRATVYDGSYHEVDSSEIAFKIASSIAFQEGAKRAKPVLLEPIMKVQVITPMEYLGDVTGDISAKRGKIEAIGDRATVKIIDAFIPLAEMFGYATKLRSMTQGRGNFTMEFSHYETAPDAIAQLIIEGKKV